MVITPQPRPKFALWRYERQLTLRATAELLAQVAGYRVCSHETVRAICLPFGHPGRAIPGVALMGAIETLTERRVLELDFHEIVRECAA